MNTKLDVCIVGAGAVGGFIAARLAAAGAANVSAIARGATLAALREHGWRLDQDGKVTSVRATATDDARALGRQDLIVVAVKAQGLPAVAPAIAAMLGGQTIVLPAMNGVPWWFCRNVPAIGDAPLASVDPGGSIAAAIPLRHVLGCVVHASTASPEPGLVRHVRGQGLIIGEPAGGKSARAARVAEVLSRAGFDVTVSADIRYDIWYKLWGNLTMNPVSALTGASSDRVLADPLVREFCVAAMREAAAIGERIGSRITETPQDRQEVARKLGAFKTSMLQDVEAGRMIELDGIVGAVAEIGRRLMLPTPNIDALLGLTRLFARVKGLYPDSPSLLSSR
ncbi:MAG TPA: 2-dehydropantoate 2-reductase [Casimicrobiaceae bacterium]|nr:2-dehydropantoate 2-reductase [Casimicrobiaceae bacterium]